jgi:predicted MPP superfamily phosphohydrolase
VKYVAYNDLHIFGPLEIIPFQDFCAEIGDLSTTFILLGDIIDLKNVRKKEIGRAKDAIMYLKTRPNVIYISGNHELLFGELPLCKQIGRAYFDHSDLISNPKRYLAFRNGEPGAGFLKRHFITPLIDSLRHLREVRPNEAMRDFVHNYKLIHPETTHMYFGHAHPEFDMEFELSGIKIKIFSRGRHEVEL